MLPSSRAPIVNQLVVYKVGSADEVYGKTGIAHFLEHMMFKGTGTVAPTEFSRTVSRNGGRDNAYTSFDTTGYYQTVAPDRLEMVMRMEADRMANLRITEKELIPERQVVLEERRMRIDNSPAALLGEAVQEQLYGRHKPYGMPISGYVDDVKKLNVHDLAAFYAKWYMPNNAILIVAGDTTADQVRKLAEKHYGPIPAAQGRSAAPAGRGRVRPAAAGHARRRARRRAALVALLPGAVLPQGREPVRLCPAGAGAPAGRRRDQPAVEGPGGRPQGRAVGVGVLQPVEPWPHLVRSRRPSRLGHAHGRGRERGRRAAGQAAR